jgi:hypothetical protein
MIGWFSGFYGNKKEIASMFLDIYEIINKTFSLYTER